MLASASQPLCIIVKSDHPLASRQRLKLAELASFRLCLPEPSFRTRQLLQEVESSEGVSLQASMTSNSITLLKSLLDCGDFVTLLPALAVSKELETHRFVAVPVDSTVLQDTSVQLISRMGRRLPPAPLKMVNALMHYVSQIAANAMLLGADVIDRLSADPAALAADEQSNHDGGSADEPAFDLYDLKVEVVSPPEPGSYAAPNPEIGSSCAERCCYLPPAQGFSIYSLASVMPLLAAKQRRLDPHDWMESDAEVACPDPNCPTRLRITRIGKRRFLRNDTTATPLPQHG